MAFPYSMNVDVAIVKSDRGSVAIVQHEYGIYRGRDGEDVLLMLDRMSIPCIVVLDSFLAQPTGNQRKILAEVVAKAEAVVVMSVTGRDRLALHYDVDIRKFSIIAHGAPGTSAATALGTPRSSTAGRRYSPGVRRRPVASDHQDLQARRSTLCSSRLPRREGAAAPAITPRATCRSPIPTRTRSGRKPLRWATIRQFIADGVLAYPSPGLHANVNGDRPYSAAPSGRSGALGRASREATGAGTCATPMINADFCRYVTTVRR